MSKPYRLAVNAIILDDKNRCLLLRRSKVSNNFVGKWEWPGGKVDEEEQFADALVREVWEETSLEVEITGHVGSTYFEIAKVHVVLLCMEACARAGEVRLSEEHDEFAWAPLNELGKWDMTDQVEPFMLQYAKSKTAA